MDVHVAGEPFALIQRDALRPLPLPSWTLGSSVSASVRNVAGASSASGSIVVSGESVRPWSPVRLQAEVDAEGTLALSWTRRTRTPSGWVDGVDVPLGELKELYRVTIVGPHGTIEIETGQPALQVPAAQLAGAGPGMATVQVRQVGDAAVSRAAECAVTI
jgi:hypothetical protein